MAKAGTPHEIIRPNFNSGNGGNGMDNQYVTHKELKKSAKTSEPHYGRALF